LRGVALAFYNPGGLTPMLEHAAETHAHILDVITIMRLDGTRSKRIVI
jgi:hypothetical protein